MYIIIAILAFGVLIASHELGHFLTAKACGVKVLEFSIGMGPALVKKQRGETTYSLRLLPIGGFCSMEGEDELTEDPRAFTRAPVWKRFLILIAGSFMNLLVGFIVVIIVFSGSRWYVGSTITELEETFPYGGEEGLMVGDEILSINGHGVWYSEDFTTYMSRAGSAPVDIRLRRDGGIVRLRDFPLQKTEYETEDGTVLRYGITFNLIEAGPWDNFKYACYSTWNFVRLVEMGLEDLLTGNVGLRDMSGVVGIVDTISEVGQQSATASDAALNIAYLCAFIAVNLAVMNMLPIPALDGGRVFCLLILSAIEAVTKKKLNPKYEAYVHAAGLVLLLGLMAVVMVNDIVRIAHG